MTEIKFKEVKTREHVIQRVTPAQLYKLLEENSGLQSTYEDFIYRLGTKITERPTMECRFHIIDRKRERHIEAICQAVAVAEEMRRLDRKLH